MRNVLLVLVLFLGACERSFIRVEDLGRKVQMEKAYEARDTCLARNAAADGTGAADPTTLAHAVAMACAAETAKLVQAVNTDGDAKVTLNVREDSEFRALHYVMKARGQAIF
jgi:hypothetical protein